ncbi:uncharacterized protein LOC120016650 isoform X1 [Tripterygium wilfordii]|uniref:uncharacterized protein LOC120016650 isoform X1 n=1 Tax=Tripterygium wilfordii TaxID=458696 RepID=UPI0018F7EC05|nr:uncharacterized protein LOC120016650 isoform X1 [Tripterygium wilfordii]
MEQIINSALEEICVQRTDGISLSTLWSRLDNDHGLSPGQKKALWANLLAVPTIQFHADKVAYSRTDPSIQCFEDAQKLGLKIIANQQLWDSFLGLYNTSTANANMPNMQRQALERIALARKNGITQSQLVKEFGTKGKNFFNPVRNLECQGLITRQSAVERTKQACSEGKVKNSSSVCTNLVHLRRYADHLGSQQKFDITREEHDLHALHNATEGDTSRDGSSAKCPKENVLIKDYVPAMKAICDKLEEETNQVLDISEIKRCLGYNGASSSHKAWKNICGRLKDDCIVEEINAKARGKVVPCLRLLKKFTPKNKSEAHIYGDEVLSKGQIVKFGRKSQISDHLVELPIDHQIYEMIDAAGSEGLLFVKVCERLGIDNKKNSSHLDNLEKRFGVCKQKEILNTAIANRVWTCKNFNLELPYALTSSSEISLIKNCDLDVDNLSVPGRSAQTLIKCGASTAEDGFATAENIDNREVDKKISDGPLSGGEAKHMLLSNDDTKRLVPQLGGTVPDADVGPVTATMEENDASVEIRLSSLNSTRNRSNNKRSYPPLTADGARRKQRILEHLQDQTFILKVELYKWLVSLEKSKGTKMCRKSMYRILNKLEEEGYCRCISLAVPAVRNYDSNRIIEVVLHPSVKTLTPKLHGEIHDRWRSFERQVRAEASCKMKDNESVSLVDVVQRNQEVGPSNALAVRLDKMFDNGFILGKMVRAKLLHCFLWDYLTSTPGWDDDLKDTSTSCLINLEAAIKAIPLELFLQVVGSTKKVDSMTEKDKIGLCLSDPHFQEYKHLHDTRTTGRVSILVNILQRLKLIGLVADGHSDDAVKVPHTTTVYSMELKAFIEEPPALFSMSSNYRFLDLCPRIRHDFIFSNRETIDQYWEILEYCYVAADRRAASRTFPGSAVREVSSHRSWASVWGMTADQRTEVLKHIKDGSPNEKPPYEKCQEIAKSLNLTLEQVLRIYSAKNRKRDRRCQFGLISNDQYQLAQNKCGSSSRKRKKDAEKRSLKHTRVDLSAQLGKVGLSGQQDNASQFIDEQNFSAASPAKCISHLQASHESETIQISENEQLNDKNENCPSSVSHYAASKMKQTPEKRFSWTAEADRQLIIQYVRHRVALGAKYNRICWASLSHLPAPPSFCRRRMALLKQDMKFRKALMRLCNIVSKRYEKYLEKIHNRSVNVDCGQYMQCSSGIGLKRNLLNDIEHKHGTSLKEELWDDFADEKIKVAFEKVLCCKNMAAIEASRRAGCFSRSQFPFHTGKRADKFSNWLQENEDDLMVKRVKLTADLQGGDIFHLFALVSSGELSILPLLPEEGVGEPEGLKSLQQSIDNFESCDGRREKGFPGIMLLVDRATTSRAKAVELFKNGKDSISELLNKAYEFHATSGHYTGNGPSHVHMNENANLVSNVPMAGDSGRSPLEALAGYSLDDIASEKSDAKLGMCLHGAHRVTILNHSKEAARPLDINQDNNMNESCLRDNVNVPEATDMDGCCAFSSADGTMNWPAYKTLASHILGIVMQNPGAKEDDIIRRMDKLNPQITRKLLEAMVLDKHLIVRNQRQSTSSGVPTILGSLIGSGFIGSSDSIYQKHFFANPVSISLL